MITLFGRLWIKDRDNLENPAVRSAWGKLCSVTGILLNLVLAVLKAWIGMVSGSMAITADAANNISDALSSVITLAGFRLAEQKADREHPFGHARIEYLAGMIVSVMILVMGFELLKDSAARILHPEPVTGGAASIAALLLSIAVKAYMAFYNTRVGKRTGSTALEATAEDSRNDCLTTAAVLCSTLILTFFGKNVDAWFGLAVSVFILYSGIRSVLETADPLLGDKPDDAYVEKIQEIVLSYRDRGILDMHDLIVHDYGPGHSMISLHVEVPSSGTLMKTHTLVDEIEHRLRSELGCEAVIHIDPVNVKDPETIQLNEKVRDLVEAMPGKVTYHDFRTIRSCKHLKIMFDVVVPYGYEMTDEEVVRHLTEELEKLKPGSELDIEIDKD